MKPKILTQSALVAIAVFIVVSLGANVYLYLQQGIFNSIGNLKEQAANLRNQISNLSNKTDVLKGENANLAAQVADRGIKRRPSATKQ